MGIDGFCGAINSALAASSLSTNCEQFSLDSVTIQEKAAVSNNKAARRRLQEPTEQSLVDKSEEKSIDVEYSLAAKDTAEASEMTTALNVFDKAALGDEMKNLANAALTEKAKQHPALAEQLAKMKINSVKQTKSFEQSIRVIMGDAINIANAGAASDAFSGALLRSVLLSVSTLLFSL